MNKKEKNLSIKWLETFIFGIIPLRAIFNIINMFRVYGNVEMWNNLVILSLIIDVIYITLGVFTYFYARKYIKIGYNLLYSLFIVDTIMFGVTAVNNIAVSSISEYFYILLFLLVFSGLVWFLPNHIYLKKRKHLFVNNDKLGKTSI